MGNEVSCCQTQERQVGMMPDVNNPPVRQIPPFRRAVLLRTVRKKTSSKEVQQHSELQRGNFSLPREVEEQHQWPYCTHPPLDTCHFSTNSSHSSCNSLYVKNEEESTLLRSAPSSSTTSESEQEIQSMYPLTYQLSSFALSTSSNDEDHLIADKFVANGVPSRNLQPVFVGKECLSSHGIAIDPQHHPLSHTYTHPPTKLLQGHGTHPLFLSTYDRPSTAGGQGGEQGNLSRSYGVLPRGQPTGGDRGFEYAYKELRQEVL